ncbi:MAG: DnaB helicase C-terminal domain-containing protein, partial [bacterium]|nr:DnaB helicase C-terminal domain-containing protein [bacterium]
VHPYLVPKSIIGQDLADSAVKDFSEGTVEGSELLRRAIQQYKYFGQHFYVIQAQKDAVSEIRYKAEEVMGNAGADQVLIIIDYLQTMPYEIAPGYRLTATKERIDALCTELRWRVRDLNSPILLISSENRDAYRINRAPDPAAFKESGGIE